MHELCYNGHMRIVSANLYVGSKQKSKDAKRLDSLNAVAYGLQEANTGTDEVLRVMRDEYHLFAAAEAGKSGREVPVLLRKRGVKYLGDGAYLISHRDRPNNKGIAPDRYLTWVRYEFQGKKYCLINLHPNAAVQNKKTGRFLSKKIKRVREYIKSMKELEEEIKAQKADGFIPIVTGDLNFRDIKAAALVRWSPVAVFKRNNMDFQAVGLDYVAWDRRRLTKRKMKIIQASQTGSDHPWIVLDLKPLGT